MKTIKVHKCTICDLVTKSAKNLDRHILALHSNERPKQCPQCPSAFKTTTDLGKHVRRVHEQLRNAQCPLCDKSKFETFTNLNVLIK